MMNVTTERAQSVLRRFGLSDAERPDWRSWQDAAGAMATRVIRHIEQGRRILISGPSGAGKSVLLQAIRERVTRGASVDGQTLSDEIAVDCIRGVELETALEILSRVGLGEVYTYLSPAARLSTGQQFRLKLAMALAHLETQGGGVLFADEFATQLDAVGAAVLARNLRRVVERSGQLATVVASCHGGLEMALRPNLVVHCDFGTYSMEGGAL